MKTKTAFEFLAWFAGVGSGCWGLARLGGKPLLAVDNWSVAMTSHTHNLPGAVLQCDIGALRQADFEAIMRAVGIQEPESWQGVHLYTPPCKRMSRASNQDPDPNHPINRLTPLVGRLAAASPKSYIIMEQVSDLVCCDKFSRIWGRLTDGLAAARGLEYDRQTVKDRYALSARHFEISQRRSRLLLPIPPKGGVLPDAPPHTSSEDIPLKDVIGADCGFQDPDPEFRELSPEEAKVNQFFRPGEQLSKTTAQRHPVLMDLWRAWGNKIRRPSWNRIGPTITSLRPMTFGRVGLVHPDELRCFSVGECRELQQFPREWILAGDIWQRYEQVGNAVPHEMVYQAAKTYLGM